MEKEIEELYEDTIGKLEKWCSKHQTLTTVIITTIIVSAYWNGYLVMD